MSHYEKLKALKMGQASDFYTALYARSVSGSKEYERFISGTPPLILSDSVGKPLVNWSITGNTVQDGTPTPENPIEIKGVGDKTGNLFCPPSLYGINVTTGEVDTNTLRQHGDDFVPVIPNATYRIKTNAIAKSPTDCNLWIIGYDENKQIITDGIFNPRYSSSLFNDTISSHIISTPFITTQSTKYIRWYTTSTPTNWDEISPMLNKGSEPLPYEPYGYKITEVTRGKNLFDINKYYGSVATVSGNSVTGRVVDIHLVNINDCFKIGKTYTFSCNAICPAETTFIRLEAEQNGSFIRSNIIKSGESGFMSMCFTPTNDCVLRITYGSGSGGIATWSNIQLELGDRATDYEPYHAETSTIYLNSPLMADEVIDSEGKREVELGVKVLTGDEKVENQSGRYDSESKSMFSIPDFTLAKISQAHKTTHFRWYTYAQSQDAPAGTFAQNRSQEYARYFYFNISNDVIGVSASSSSAEKQEAFKQWLKSEYDAGHPVTVYYQLSAPTSETVDVPAITTLKGNTVIDVDTEVQPTNMSVTYKSRR